MKRKIFSKLLMGALLVASVSSFTSCKDYDDDINSLKESVAKAALQSNLEALTQQVNSIKTTAEAAATKVDLEAVKKDAAKGLEDAAKGIAAAADAQKAADAANALAQKAQEAADAIDLTAYAKKDEVESMAALATQEITAIKSQIATFLTADQIEAQLAALKQEVAEANEAQMTEMKAKVDNAVAGVNAIWNAVTSVDLLTSMDGGLAWWNTQNIVFVTGSVPADATFGKEEKVWGKNYFSAIATDLPIKTYNANSTVSYKKKEPIRFEKSFIVRVNPANANLTKENFKIVNSNMESIAGVVDINSVEPLKGLITRGTSANGLWQVNIQLTDASKLNAKRLDSYGRNIEFAVVVNNTVNQDADRNVISSYDISFAPAVAYKPSVDILGIRIKTAQTKDDGNANLGRMLAFIHNRYANTTGQDGSYSASKGAQTLDPKNWEYRPSVYNPAWWGGFDRADNTTWEDATKDIGEVYDATAGLPDNREGANVTYNGVTTNIEYVIANVGESIDISFAELSDIYGNNKVDKFYVVLDDVNAQESAPSEENAWNSYTYEGLKTLFDAKEGGSIKVTKMDKAQDYIGFRIFAVNLDGTLVDKDGAAFYAYVGNESAGATVTADYYAYATAADAATSITTDIYPVTGNLVAASTTGTGNKVADVQANTYTVKFSDTKIFDVKATFYQDAAGNTAASDWTNAKYVKFNIVKNTAANNIRDWADNGTGKFTIQTTDKGGAIENQIVVSLTKKLPTAEWTKAWMGYTWKDGQLSPAGVFTSYLYPVNAGVTLETDETAVPTWTNWNPAADPAEYSPYGYKSMNLSINNLGKRKAVADPYVSFANAQLKTNSSDLKDYYTDSYTATETGFILNVNNAADAANTLLIDNKTEHDSYIGCNFGKVSSASTKDYTVAVENFKTVFACPLHTDVQKYSFVKYTNTKDDVTVTSDVNYLVYGNGQVAPNTKDATGAPVVIYLARYIKAENTFANAQFGGTLRDVLMKKYYAYGTTPTVKATAKLISNKSKEEDYFSVEFKGGVTDPYLEFTPKLTDPTSNPLADVESTLILTFYDAFGHKHEYSLPFTVKRQS